MNKWSKKKNEKWKEIGNDAYRVVFICKYVNVCVPVPVPVSVPVRVSGSMSMSAWKRKPNTNAKNRYWIGMTSLFIGYFVCEHCERRSKCTHIFHSFLLLFASLYISLHLASHCIIFFLCCCCCCFLFLFIIIFPMKYCEVSRRTELSD